MEGGNSWDGSERVAKYQAFSKRCMEDYVKKMNESDKVFVEQKK